MRKLRFHCIIIGKSRVAPAKLNSNLSSIIHNITVPYSLMLIMSK